MTPKLTALRTSNLGEQTYDALVNALMKGILHGGDRLRIHAIARDLGTSITPVRDAILRLVQDEALVMRNARDIRVPAISAAQYLEIRNIRLELEGLAAEQAAGVASPADMVRLEVLIRENEKAIKRRDHAEGTALNQAFHAELATIGQAPILLGILRRLWMRIGPFISDAYEQGGRMLTEHHYAILDAIKSHDPQQARAAVRRDILEGSAAVLQASPGAVGAQQPRRKKPTTQTRSPRSK